VQKGKVCFPKLWVLGGPHPPSTSGERLLILDSFPSKTVFFYLAYRDIGLKKSDVSTPSTFLISGIPKHIFHGIVFVARQRNFFSWGSLIERSDVFSYKRERLLLKAMGFRWTSSTFDI